MANYFEVDEIIGSRMYKDRKEYFVRWLGYDETEDTWEPEETLLEDCPGKVKAYLSRHAANLGTPVQINPLESVQPNGAPQMQPKLVTPNGAKVDNVSPERESPSRTQPIAFSTSGTQININSPVIKTFDVDYAKEQAKVLKDYVDKEIEKITLAKKTNSIFDKYFFFTFLKETAPLFFVFLLAALFAFLLPYLPTVSPK